MKIIKRLIDLNTLKRTDTPATFVWNVEVSKHKLIKMEKEGTLCGLAGNEPENFHNMPDGALLDVTICAPVSLKLLKTIDIYNLEPFGNILTISQEHGKEGTRDHLRAMELKVSAPLLRVNAIGTYDAIPFGDYDYSYLPISDNEKIPCSECGTESRLEEYGEVYDDYCQDYEDEYADDLQYQVCPNCGAKQTKGLYREEWETPEEAVERIKNNLT